MCLSYIHQTIWTEIQTLIKHSFFVHYHYYSLNYIYICTPSCGLLYYYCAFLGCLLYLKSFSFVYEVFYIFCASWMWSFMLLLYCVLLCLAALLMLCSSLDVLCAVIVPWQFVFLSFRAQNMKLLDRYIAARCYSLCVLLDVFDSRIA